MTKQDFELIARVLRDNLGGPDMPQPLRHQLIREFARELHGTNPRFDVGRFRAACLGEDSYDSAGRRVRYSS